MCSQVSVWGLLYDWLHSTNSNNPGNSAILVRFHKSILLNITVQLTASKNEFEIIFEKTQHHYVELHLFVMPRSNISGAEHNLI